VREIRRLLAAAFAGHEDGDFTEDDWQHSIGGVHVVLELDGSIAGHAWRSIRGISARGWERS